MNNAGFVSHGSKNSGIQNQLMQFLFVHCHLEDDFIAALLYLKLLIVRLTFYLVK